MLTSIYFNFIFTMGFFSGLKNAFSKAGNWVKGAAKSVGNTVKSVVNAGKSAVTTSTLR